MGLKHLPLLLLAGVMALVFGLGLHRHLSLEALIANRAAMRLAVEQNWLLALSAFALVYALAVALSIPGAVFLTIGGGAVFGGLVGGSVSVVAATLGALLLFQIARTSLGTWLARRAGPGLSRLLANFNADAVSYLLFLRLVPLFPFALVNLAPALAGVGLRTFAWTTLIGILPGTFAFAFAGAGLDSVLARQATERAACLAAGRGDCPHRLGLDAFVTRELLLACVLLGVVALIPVVWRRIWGKGSAGPAKDECR